MNRLTRVSAACLLVVVCMLAVRADPDNKPGPRHNKPSEIYVVTVWDDDFYPYWQATIFQLVQEADGVRARYSYIASSTLPCNEPDIRYVDHFAAGADIVEITKPLDLCRVGSERINRQVETKSKKPAPFATVRKAVVVNCGDGERLFRLPEFKMNTTLLKRTAPQAIELLNLDSTIAQRAFPSDMSRMSGDQQPVADEAALSLLRSGHFDKGFWFGFRGVHPAIPARVVTSADPTVGSSVDWGKFRNVLNGYRKPATRVLGRQGELIDTEGYRIVDYVVPRYSPLALRAGVESRVELELKVNRQTGLVESVKGVGGHPLVVEIAVDAARQWRFDVSQELPPSIKATLRFSLACQQ